MVNTIAFLTASLAALGSASSVFLVTHQVSNATSGTLSVQDEVLVYSTKEPVTKLCQTTAKPNMSCSVAGLKNGSSCKGIYHGPNKDWNNRDIEGVFDKHKGNYVSAGKVFFPGNKYSIVQTDKRCAPYDCAGVKTDIKVVYKGFLCQI